MIHLVQKNLKTLFMRKLLLVILLGILPRFVNAQMWQELVALQNESPNDSFACGVSLWCSNIISKIEGRDYTSDSKKKVSYFNPALTLEIAYDILFNTQKKTHVFIGWNGSFYGDDCMTRIKLGFVQNSMTSFGVLLGKRIVADNEGRYFTRRGKYRHDDMCGVFFEQHQKSFTISLYGEYSKKELYHFAEISRRLTENPRCWIAVGSESLRGYGPRVYYKMINRPMWLQFSMNFAPSMYKYHDNVSDNFSFGMRRMFY